MADTPLYYRCVSEGSPTVILDAGLGDTSDTWLAVESEIARFTRTLVYDRANLGKSKPSPPPRTSAVMVNELRNLLSIERLEGPYLLVGHSFGGLNMMLFAALYPEETAGIVLVDSVHPNLEPRFLAMLSPTQEQRYRNARNDEGVTLDEKILSGQQLTAALPLPDVPLTVLVRERSPYESNGFPGEFEQSWQKMQRELAQLTSHGRLVVVENSGHYIHRDQPKHVIDAIYDLVEKVRGNEE